jgi:hypothetical protein
LLHLAVPERFLDLSDVRPTMTELLQRRNALKRS